MDVDQSEVAAVARAVKETVKSFVYMGIAVGMYVTDEECDQVATAAVDAINKHRSVNQKGI